MAAFIAGMPSCGIWHHAFLHKSLPRQARSHAHWLATHTALLLHAVRALERIMERSLNNGTYTLWGGGGGGVGVPFG